MQRTLTQWTVRRSVVVPLSVSAVCLVIALSVRAYGLQELAVDRSAVLSWLAGTGLYTGQPNATFPPPTAFFLLPAAVLPLQVAGWLTALAGSLALILALFTLVGPIARRYGKGRWPLVGIAVALALAVEPVRSVLGLGKLDLLLFGLVAADVVALRRSAWASSRAAWWPGRPASMPQRGFWLTDLIRRGWSTGAWAGAGVGAATAMAVTPAFFIGYLLLTRQWRAAWTAICTASGLTGCALVLAPHESFAWFSGVLGRFDDVGDLGNQSLAGVLARLYDSATMPVLLWLSFGLLLAAVGLIRARNAHAEGDEIAAFTLVGLTAAIVGPVTDPYEIIWIVVAIVIMLDAACRQRVTSRRPYGPGPRYPGLGYACGAAATYGLFVLAPMAWLAPLGGLTGTVGGNAYAMALILLVNTLPWRPGVAPAYPVNRWLRPPTGPRRPIPAPRGS